MTFGRNYYGQLGLGNSGYGTDKSVPSLVQFDERAEIVSCGTDHTAIVTKRGKLMTFGDHTNGQLGLGDYEQETIRVLPTLVESVKDKNVRSVSCGREYTAIIV